MLATASHSARPCPVTARPSILIVDDHASIRDPLAVYLRRYEFDVETVADGQAMRALLAQRSFNLIVLDIMLPGEDGLSLCRFVSERLQIPVILLTAVTDQADRVTGLEVGADDYVVKPFDPRELVARIRSVLRRSQARPGSAVDAASASTPAPAAERVLAFEGWQLDIGRRQLTNPDGQPVSLSTSEFHLLRVLADNPNRVLSRVQLLDLTHGSDSPQFDRSIDTQISRLRRKLEVDARNPTLLKTVRGDGYLFAARVEPVET